MNELSGKSDNSERLLSKNKFVSTISKERDNSLKFRDEHTPRFSVTNRTNIKSPNSCSDFNISPGPACYDTRVESCVRSRERQPSFTTEKRFIEVKQAALPEAGFYDTRPSVHLLLKKGPSVKITTAKRVIAAHNFHAKNGKAFVKGITLKE